MSDSSPEEFNYDESRVPPYTLPSLLGEGDHRVTSADEWESSRRPEILKLFSEHVYGVTPTGSWKREVVSKRIISDFLFEHGVLEEWEIRMSSDLSECNSYVLVAVPHGKGPFPAFCGLNFHGNQTSHPSPLIPISQRWVRNRDDWGVSDNRSGESTRGVSTHRWPYDDIMKRGYAVATAHSADFAPDGPEHYMDGVYRLFSSDTSRKEDTWGAIGMWAWGLSRIRESLAEDPRIDGKRIAVTGHSRMGKAALWAGAQDKQFGMAVSNDSGCGGASLSRRWFGETVARINRNFPHWFCPRFHDYSYNENRLPVDQHMLLALIAPRPLHVCSAAEDLWADPRGEFLSAKHAAQVYTLLGKHDIADFNADFPGEDGFLRGRLAYHIRPGKHDITPLDWERHLDTADQFMV